MAFRVGDILRQAFPDGPVYRLIVAVRPTGYSWRYPDVDGPYNEWMSENSTEPFLDRWQRVPSYEVAPALFGTKCDGIADDTAAMQRYLRWQELVRRARDEEEHRDNNESH